jgi:tripartite-type tricarboxylate transporter receptor subunit TctC
MNTDLVLVAKNVFNLNVRVVRGYQGPGEIAMAMERNEIVGRSFGMVALEMFSSDLVKEGKLRFLVQFGRKRWSGLLDVPTAHELAQSADDNALIDLAEVPLLLARPYLAPPQIPPAATAILRKAFMDTQADPDYLADNEKLKSDVSPLSGEEIQQLVERIGKTPPALVERYKAAVEAK